MKTRKYHLKKSLRLASGCLLIVMILPLYPSRQQTLTIQNPADSAKAYFTSTDVVRVLIGALADKNLRVKSCALKALGDIGKPAQAAIPSVLQLLTCKNILLRCRVIESLAKIAPHNKAAAKRLGEIFKNNEGDIKAGAAQALAIMQAKFAIPLLIDALKDSDGFVRENAALALGKLKSKTATNALIAALHDKDGAVQAAAALSLGQIRPKGQATIIALIAALNQSGNVRYAAVHSLGSLGAQAMPAVPILVKFLEYGEIRKTASEALVKIAIESRSAVTLLIEAFRVENEEIRMEIASILGNMTNNANKVIPALAAALDDEDIGETVAYALALLGKKAVPTIIYIINNERGLAKCNAALALGRIAHQENHGK